MQGKKATIAPRIKETGSGSFSVPLLLRQLHPFLIILVPALVQSTSLIVVECEMSTLRLWETFFFFLPRFTTRCKQGDMSLHATVAKL